MRSKILSLYLFNFFRLLSFFLISLGALSFLGYKVPEARLFADKESRSISLRGRRNVFHVGTYQTYEPRRILRVPRADTRPVSGVRGSWLREESDLNGRRQPIAPMTSVRYSGRALAYSFQSDECCCSLNPPISTFVCLRHLLNRGGIDQQTISRSRRRKRIISRWDIIGREFIDVLSHDKIISNVVCTRAS